MSAGETPGAPIELIPLKEALKQAGISRSTYFLWIRKGRIADARFRDRNEWRVLTPDEVESLKRESLRVIDTRAIKRAPVPFRAPKSDAS